MHDSVEDSEPVFLLSLDGGGVRGISEAVILHEIMTRLQKACQLPDLPKPCEYFHLIGGTSTGGLIAIMLGRLRMDTQQVINEYESLSSLIFRWQNRSLKGNFQESVLESAIRDVVKKQTTEYGMLDFENISGKGLAFVVALLRGGDDNVPALFRTYESPNSLGDCRIWEAARATTAAPMVFKPAKFTLEGKPMSFLDGAAKHNNPSKLVLNEARAQFGSERPLGCLLSLGTGARPPAFDREEKGFFGTLGETMKMVLGFLTDPVGAHLDVRDRLEEFPNAYFRFSLPLVYTKALGRVSISAYKKMAALRRATEEYLRDPRISIAIDKVVQVLKETHSSRVSLKAACQVVTQTRATEALDGTIPTKLATPIFTGREVILSMMEEYFFGPMDPLPRFRNDLWLWGIGGIGKTQIAHQFRDRHHSRFEHIFWIDATDQSTIRQSLKNAACQLFQSRDASCDGKLLIPWLESTDKTWLIIVDNYDDGDITKFLPNDKRGNIIFTGRRRDLRPLTPGAQHIRVVEMSLEDSVTLLLRSAHMDADSEELREQAKGLVEELGFMPLAIDQAGTYIGVRGVPFSQYLKKFRDRRKQLMTNPVYRGTLQQNQGVYSSFELTMDNLQATSRSSSNEAFASRAALQLLNIICFFHHRDLSLDFVGLAWQRIQFTRLEPALLAEEDMEPRRTYEHSGGPAEPSIRDFLGLREDGEFDVEPLLSGVKVLLTYSIVRPQHGEKLTLFSMHPLLHSWLRERMMPTTYETYHRVSRAIIFASIDPKVRNRHFDRHHARVLPHLKAVRSFVPESDGHKLRFDEKTAMDRKFAYVLNVSGMWEESIDFLNILLRERSFEYGRYHRNTVNIMFQLGLEYKALGRWDEAETTLLQYGELLDMHPGERWAQKEHIGQWFEIAVVLLYRRRHREAENIIDMADKNVRNLKLGMTARCTVLRLRSLVAQYELKWADAENFSEQALEEYAKLDIERVPALSTRRELAFVRVQLGRAAAVERELLYVAERLEYSLGPSHYEVLMAKSDVGWAYYKQGKLQEAAEVLGKALKTGRATLGNTHPYTLTLMFRLGLTVADAGNTQLGISLVNGCLEGRGAILMLDHPATLGTRGWLHLLLRRQLQNIEVKCLNPQLHGLDLEIDDRHWDEAGSVYRPFAELPFSFSR